ncbi:MAG: hypothetical protein LGB70_02955 [Sulfurovum sp.]|nr:hypothetical protein [Sulfurovum sp.]
MTWKLDEDQPSVVHTHAEVKDTNVSIFVAGIHLLQVTEVLVPGKHFKQTSIMR